MLLRHVRNIALLGILVALTALIGVAGAIDAQQPRPQAGTAERPQPAAAPEPNRLGQPLLDPNGFVRDDAMLKSTLLPEDRKYGDIDGRHLKQLLMEVDAISLKDRDSGNLFWGRNVGTPGHDATQAWVEGQFKKSGLQDIHKIPFDLAPQWTPKAWELTFTSGGKPLTLVSARPATRTSSTPADGLEWELAWAGSGNEADFIGRDVKGKAVLIQDIPLPGDIRHSADLDGVVARAFAHGAAAVGLMFGISDNFAIWQDTAGRPGFNVGFEDGRRLRDLIGQGQTVKVKFKMTSEMRPGLKTASVMGVLPGTSDEDITIFAHMDGFFRASLDNASGLAVMMGLVEHFAKVPQAQRKRAIRFVGSAGHHGGPGTRWFHDNKDTALAKTALAINLEHVAAVRSKYWGYKLRMTTGVAPMRWWVWGSRDLMNATLSAFSRFNVGVTADMDPNASGEMGTVSRDVPSIQVITSPEIKHTEQDTPEWVPSSGLEEIARAYAKIIDEVNTMDRARLQPASSPRTQAAR